MQDPRYDYSALSARDGDGAPGGATHAVFAGDGALAGFVSASGTAWQGDGSPAGQAGTLADAVAIVAELDLELLGIASPCGECAAVAGRPCEVWCIADMAGEPDDDVLPPCEQPNAHAAGECYCACDGSPTVTCRPIPWWSRLADRVVQVMALATVIAGLLYIAGYPR